VVLDFIINILLLMGIISLFNLGRVLFKVRKMIKMHKDNPNIQGISIVNGEVKVIEKKPSEIQVIQEELPKVIDEMCGKEVKEADAYRVVIDGKEHCFCSWECREAFINKEKKEGV